MKNYVRIGNWQFELKGLPTAYQLDREYKQLNRCYKRPSERKINFDYTCFSFVADTFGIDNVDKMGIYSHSGFLLCYGAVVKNPMLGGRIVVEITPAHNRIYVDPKYHYSPAAIQFAIGLQRGRRKSVFSLDGVLEQFNIGAH